MRKSHLFFLAIIFFFFKNFTVSAQSVYEHVSTTGIYEFLDELANLGIIDLNSAVKPYSREYISVKLKTASEKSDKLTIRQKKELDFYLKAYFLESGSKPTSLWEKVYDVNGKARAGLSSSLYLYYTDSVLKIAVRPVFGLMYYGNDTGHIKHRWNGAEVSATVGKSVGIYASLRDNNESGRLTSPLYFNQRFGVPVKNFGDKGVDYSESRGGITYSWRWGTVGLIKDHFVWGDNYHGANIFSGRAPSMAQLILKLYPASWIEFNYVHAWLVSNVVDSARSYWDTYVYRPVFHNKFLAANLLTITPLRGLKLSFGNSIIYSDLGVHPGYLNPFMFYKSVDHTLNNTNASGETGQNAQMFFNISSRQINGLHFYSSLYFDELNIGRIKEGKIHNYFSLKAGMRTTNIGIPNLSLTAEYTMTKPLAYAHKISTTTFASNDFNLGHYLRDNSKEIYFSVGYKPWRELRIQADYCIGKHYNDYGYDNRPDINEYVPFKDLTWESKEAALKMDWEVIYNAGLRLSLSSSETKGYSVDGKPASYYLDRYTPKLYQGKHFNLMAGFYVGF
ncbi:MAG: hypothetical protein PWP07_1282 [Epulopiscium sp.]|nr:hypothetical protein [Candidatus Epulonipiscium sp.]